MVATDQSETLFHEALMGLGNALAQTFKHNRDFFLTLANPLSINITPRQT